MAMIKIGQQKQEKQNTSMKIRKLKHQILKK